MYKCNENPQELNLLPFMKFNILTEMCIFDFQDKNHEHQHKIYQPRNKLAIF